MLKIANQLLRYAEALIPSLELKFTCKSETEPKALDAACAELQDLLNRIRQNEELQFITTRINDGKSITMQVGISNCEAKQSILNELCRKARIQGKKRNLIVKEKLG